MSPEIIGAIGIIFLLVLIALRMYLGLAIALIGIVGVLWIQGLEKAYVVAGQAPFNFIFKYNFATLPMFILMGNIVSQTGIGADLYYTAHKWIGQLRGGLAMATNAACALLAAITGSSMSGIIIMSKVALPEMQKLKYDDRLSTGVIASASTMGILIPPSIGFILYGLLTEESVGKLFMAGLIPGILEAVFYMAVIFIMCRLNPEMGPPGPKSTFKEKVFSLKNTWATLVLFLLVIGGIYGGVFTPTEAGAIGSMGAIIIALSMRRLNAKTFLETLLESGLMVGMVLLILMGVAIMIKFTAVSKLPFVLGEIAAGLDVPPIMIIIAIVIMYVILGCFMDVMMVIMLTVPIIHPIIVSLGFNPIWFGVIIVRMAEIGGITPPFGMQGFVLSGMSGVPLGTIYRGVLPFVIADFLHIAMLIAFPIISLFLPNLMSY